MSTLACVSCLAVRVWSRATMVALAAVFVLASATAQVCGQDNEVEQADDHRAQLETQFQEMLDGATLVGHFTVTGREALEPKEERYNIQSVEKLPGGRWMFRSRIRYSDHDVTVPLPLPVEWAGDTPVIVVDNVQIPGLGTYQARVMFFDDHYAGYWRGGNHGGHLFGVIERDDAEDETEDASDDPSEDDQ